LITLPKNFWTRVLVAVVIQLYTGECTPSVDRALELAKFMYLLHNQKLPKLFFKLSNVHSYATRQKRNIVYFKPCIKNTIGKRLLSHRGSKVW